MNENVYKDKENKYGGFFLQNGYPSMESPSLSLAAKPM